MSKIEEIDKISNNKRVVVMIGASWCGPCKLKKPIFLQLKERHPELHMEFIDGDDEPEFKQEHGVKAYPTFIMLESAYEKKRFEGARQTMAELEAWIVS